MDYDDDEPDTSPEAKAARREVALELAKAEGELLELCSAPAADVEQQRARAELESRVWSLRSIAAARINNTAQAVACGTQAAKFGDLAVKLVKGALADRVSALERALERGQRQGGSIRAAAKRRKQA